MIKQLARKIHLLYDMFIHGYDTTRNFHISTNGKITYLKDLKPSSPGDILHFPTEFAKANSRLYSLNLESKTEPEYYI